MWTRAVTVGVERSGRAKSHLGSRRNTSWQLIRLGVGEGKKELRIVLGFLLQLQNREER